NVISTRLFQPFLRCVWVVAEVRIGLTVVRVAFRQEGRCFHSLARHVVVHQLLLIDSAVKCLADTRIIEWFLLRIEEQEWQVEAFLFFNSHASPLEKGSVVSGDILNNVSSTGLTSVGTCGVIDQDVPHQLAVGGFLLTVVMLIWNCNYLRICNRLILIWAGTDWHGGEFFIGGRFRNDLDHGEALFEQLEWVLQLQRNGGVIFCFNSIDEINHVRVNVSFSHSAFKGGNNISGSYIRTIGELRTLTDGDLILSVGDFGWLIFSGQRLIYRVIRKILLIQALNYVPVGSHCQRR